MTEPSPPTTRASDLAAAREAVDRLMEAHGPEVYRYCVAMLGPEGAAAMLPTIFGHLQDHAAEHELPLERLVALAVAHNRCVERSRTGGRAPTGQRLDAEVARVARAIAQLKPVGRDAVLLRSVLGLRWPELERVCGVPTARMVERLSRGWRNTGEVVAGRPASIAGRPAGQRLRETDQAWAAIREDARRFVGLREALREATRSYVPPDGWRDEVWQRLEDAREDQRRVAIERAAERAAAEAARAAKASEAAAAERAAAERAAGAFVAAVDEDEAEDRTPVRSRGRGWGLRWLGVGVVLALVGLAARWLMLP